jgi:hypothetical protein
MAAGAGDAGAMILGSIILPLNSSQGLGLTQNGVRMKPTKRSSTTPPLLMCSQWSQNEANQTLFYYASSINVFSMESVAPFSRQSDAVL